MYLKTFGNWYMHVVKDIYYVKAVFQKYSVRSVVYIGELIVESLLISIVNVNNVCPK